jgi:glyoxylase-like metal-dependent hydrolase (beta-lactamase superfamily II)
VGIQDQVSHPFEERIPQPGEAIEVAQGIWWIRMPLPFALDHINLWLLEDGDGWTLVDTGYGVAATWELWERHFAGVMANRPVKNIVVTHYHPDHVGSAAWLVERTNMPGKIWIYAVIPMTFAMPALIQAMAWVLLLSPRSGWINRWLQDWLELSAAPFNIYSITGMSFVEGLRLVPTACLVLVPLPGSITQRSGPTLAAISDSRPRRMESSTRVR